MSEILQNSGVKTEEVYYFDYVSEHSNKGVIAIIFQNGKFYEANFPFTGRYSREQWGILAAIEAKITEIEEKYAKVSLEKNSKENS